MAMIEPRTVGADPLELSRLKQDLAIGYRLLGQAGLGKGILAHLTARLPGSQTFWTYQLGQSVEEVRISDLREADFNAQALDGTSRINPSIRAHGAVYRARPDILCISHNHGDNAVAMGAIGANLVPFDRNAARWAGEIAIVEDFEDVPDIADQGQAYARSLGTGKALILKHHGVLVTGTSVADAVVSSIELDRSFGVQLKAMAAGNLHLMGPGEITECKKFLGSQTYVDLNWAYLNRVLERSGGRDGLE